ncbi:MAG TPA: photosynthetic reaction center cytochrome c subunit family protein, partial [Pyrinomonadaceae bacterium]|nr:photosynthetic reaction center cytochrome c subunit family protein [Pyrinomonadaceae bacterium]
MKLWWKLVMTAAGLAVLWSGFAFVNPVVAQTQAPALAPGKKAGEYFKNVTTSTLKELSVDDFLSSMGVISGALGFDCADCHPGAGTDQVNFVIDTIPQKRTARRMIEMVATINRTNFAGVQRVTCFTCHHGRETPTTTIALDNLYNS